MKKILIMGLPGSGKTTLAIELKELLQRCASVQWFNADDIRKIHNDWDFSYLGRIRQSERMLALSVEATADFVICDFIAPLNEMRKIFDPDYVIWVDTISRGNHEDTNKIFESPTHYDLKVTHKDAITWAKAILGEFKSRLWI